MKDTEEYIDVSDIDVSEYENMIFHVPTVEEMKEEVKRMVIDLTREERDIKKRKIKLLSALSDKEKTKEIYDTVVKLHGAAIKGEVKDANEISVVLDEQEIGTFNKSKNENFYKSGEVMQEYSKDPNQLTLVKNKTMTRRGMKKQKTPNQHLLYVMKAKKDADLLRRVEILEDKMRMVETKTYFYDRALLDYYQLDLDMTNLPEDMLATLTARNIAAEKIALYTLKYYNPKMSQASMSKLIGRSVRTVQTWL